MAFPAKEKSKPPTDSAQSAPASDGSDPFGGGGDPQPPDDGGGDPFGGGGPGGGPPPSGGMPMSGGAPPPGAGGADSPFAPTQGFGGGAVEGQPPTEQSPMEQNEGLFSQIQEIQMGVAGSTHFLMALSQQFPGTAQQVRVILEALQAVDAAIPDLIQALTVDAAMPTPMAPRSGY